MGWAGFGIFDAPLFRRRARTGLTHHLESSLWLVTDQLGRLSPARTATGRRHSAQGRGTTSVERCGTSIAHADFVLLEEITHFDHEHDP